MLNNNNRNNQGFFYNKKEISECGGKLKYKFILKIKDRRLLCVTECPQEGKPACDAQ